MDSEAWYHSCLGRTQRWFKSSFTDKARDAASRIYTDPVRIVLFAALLFGCTTAKPPRHIDITLHADTDFSPEQRQDLRGAATLWSTTTKGSARINLVFDVEPTINSYLEHQSLRHSTVSHVNQDSIVAKTIDVITDRGERTQTIAITQNDGRGHVSVIFIDDRIKRSQYFSIAAHELGHAIGLPDIEEPKAIMSRVQDERPVNQITPSDYELCKTARYCNE